MLGTVLDERTARLRHLVFVAGLWASALRQRFLLVLSPAVRLQGRGLSWELRGQVLPPWEQAATRCLGVQAGALGASHSYPVGAQGRTVLLPERLGLAAARWLSEADASVSCGCCSFQTLTDWWLLGAVDGALHLRAACEIGAAGHFLEGNQVRGGGIISPRRPSKRVSGLYQSMRVWVALSAVPGRVSSHASPVVGVFQRL